MIGRGSSPDHPIAGAAPPAAPAVTDAITTACAQPGDRPGRSSAGVVVLDGDLDIARVSEVTARLALAMGASDGDIQVDSSGVEFIDAGVLGALVDAAGRLAGDDRSLRIVNAPPCVRRIVQITNLDIVLNLA